jgi:hypothetical protein
MKVIDKTRQTRKIIEITNARGLEGHKIRIEFRDGTTKVVDFSAFLQSARDPVTRRYLDPRKFRQFTIRHGNLNWNDYEMCFPVADLYRGRVK